MQAFVAWGAAGETVAAVPGPDVETSAPPASVPAQTPGGKGPLLRPAYDHLADLRMGETGDTLRTVRELQRSIDETARQERELVPA